jgi:hypothetical protein
MVLTYRETNYAMLALGQRLIAQETAEANGKSQLEINVVFTNTEGTLAALKLAGDLACNLSPRIKVLVAQAVPLAFPLTRPPVSIRFTEQRLLEIAHRGVQGPLDTAVRLYLCRDPRQVLTRVLKPKSLVIIGGKRRWWPTEQSKLAKMLRSQGHQVILAPHK